MFMKKFFLSAVILFCLPILINAQKRDNLTDQEDMNVRDAQQVDLRMKVFIKVIDRRLLALNDANAAQSKQAQKDLNDWGELRTGTRTELTYDIQRTLEEAIAKIDDVAERDQKNPLFPKAVNALAKACREFNPQFSTLRSKAAEDKERLALENSIDSCNQVIEASVKVPKEEKKK